MVMKKILVGFLSLVLAITVTAKEKEAKTALPTESNAAVVVTGSISDAKSGESLVGVEVKLEGTDLKTYTDFDGNFTFNNVKPGNYNLVTSYISYREKTENLQVSSKENELKIKLQSSN
jgi:uncharacterized surface anchored protein